MTVLHVSPRGRALIKHFEGFRTDAYQDVVGVWTIGFGFTHGVQPGQHMTLAQAEARLITELLQYEQAVLSACAVEPNQNQFDALCCFAWNVGIAGFRRSTVLNAHNRGDYQSAARAFGLWNKAGGKVWPGLTRRRAAESALYLRPVPGVVQRVVEGVMPSAHADELPSAHGLASPPLDEMPQAVDAERPLTASTINRAGALAGGTAAVAAASEAVNTVASVKAGVDNLGNWLLPVLLITVVALCGYIIWERVQQRRKGWA